MGTTNHSKLGWNSASFVQPFRNTNPVSLEFNLKVGRDFSCVWVIGPPGKGKKNFQKYESGKQALGKAGSPGEGKFTLRGEFFSFWEKFEHNIDASNSFTSGWAPHPKDLGTTHLSPPNPFIHHHTSTLFPCPPNTFLWWPPRNSHWELHWDFKPNSSPTLIARNLHENHPMLSNYSDNSSPPSGHEENRSFN